MKVTVLQLLILSLASFRLTRLFVFDKITEFIRSPFFDEIEEDTGEGGTEVYYIPKKTPIKRFFGELLSCYWCTGIWVSAGMVLLHMLFPNAAEPVILILAVAGISSIIETMIQHFMQK